MMRDQEKAMEIFKSKTKEEFMEISYMERNRLISSLRFCEKISNRDMKRREFIGLLENMFGSFTMPHIEGVTMKIRPSQDWDFRVLYKKGRAAVSVVCTYESLSMCVAEPIAEIYPCHKGGMSRFRIGELDQMKKGIEDSIKWQLLSGRYF